MHYRHGRKELPAAWSGGGGWGLPVPPLLLWRTTILILPWGQLTRLPCETGRAQCPGERWAERASPCCRHSSHRLSVAFPPETRCPRQKSRIRLGSSNRPTGPSTRSPTPARRGTGKLRPRPPNPPRFAHQHNRHAPSHHTGTPARPGSAPTHVLGRTTAAVCHRWTPGLGARRVEGPLWTGVGQPVWEGGVRGSPSALQRGLFGTRAERRSAPGLDPHTHTFLNRKDLRENYVRLNSWVPKRGWASGQPTSVGGQMTQLGQWGNVCPARARHMPGGLPLY